MIFKEVIVLLKSVSNLHCLQSKRKEHFVFLLYAWLGKSHFYKLAQDAENKMLTILQKQQKLGKTTREK